MTKSANYALRLPISLKEAVANAAAEDGISINQYITLAVAEKLSVQEAARFFQERQERVDMDAFRAILNREGGEAPRSGDELSPAK
jgi:hypothetical protein